MKLTFVNENNFEQTHFEYEDFMIELASKIKDAIGYGASNFADSGFTTDENGKELNLHVSNRKNYSGPELDSTLNGQYIITITKLEDYINKKKSQ